MLCILSWNVNGQHLWDQLAASGVDVALLQEAPVPLGSWEGQVVPHPAVGWGTAGSSKWRRTAVVAVSETTLLVPRPLTSIEEAAPGALLVSRRGTLAAADVVVNGERITLVSMYAVWERSPAGHRPSNIYADASAHRLLSDLSGIVNDACSYRIVAAGDLNSLHRYGEYGDSYWAARYATVFDEPRRWGCDSWGRRRPPQAGESAAGGVAGRLAGCPDLSHSAAGFDGCGTSTRLCLRFSRFGGPAIRACSQYRSR